MVTPSPCILVLHEALGADARPDEADALVQVEQVSRALEQLGWPVSALATGLDLASTLGSIRERRPRCVFNLVESLAGDGRLIHFIPSLLPLAGIAYTGSDSDAIYLSSHKLLAKEWMVHRQIPTTEVLSPETRRDNGATWIVKSLWEHASFGMDDGCVVLGATAARARIEACRNRMGGEWFAERFVDGREFNISVLENDGLPKVLPIAEMTFVDYPPDKPRIVGYAAKWDPDAPEYRTTCRSFAAVSAGLRGRLEAIVRKCWTAFALKGYARIDIRLDAAGTPWVLEVNANPCLSADAGFAAAAREAGMNYQELIERVLQAALRPETAKARLAGA